MAGMPIECEALLFCRSGPGRDRLLPDSDISPFRTVCALVRSYKNMFIVGYAEKHMIFRLYLKAAVSMSKCNKTKLIGPVCFKVKSVFRKEQLGRAFPVQ